MLDIQFIRDNADLVQDSSKNKGLDVDIKQLLELDGQRRDLLQEVEKLRHDQNQAGKAFSAGNIDQSNRDAFRHQKQMIHELTENLKKIESQFTQLLKQVPNVPLEDVPVGASEQENVVAKKVGEPKKFDFEPKNHAELAEAKGWLDKERAAKVAGSRFAYIKGDLVKLQFAIIQFVLSTLTDEAVLKKIADDAGLKVTPKAFIPILPPLMIRTDLYDAMDRLEPRDDRYKLEDEDLWLQGSAEHVLGSMHADEIFEEKDLPLRYIGYATSFRREAGTYGKDMEGLFRMHQFDKLEMESFTTAKDGLQEHLFLIAIQEYLMTQLDLPYQVLMKCTADIGKPNARGVDIEAWLPGQDKYRETHTADYMTDYQARRLKTRVRREDGSVELIHTNDATAFALSRTPIAILENHQDKDGKVKVPNALQPFMGGQESI